MTVNIEKPEFNIREKINELNKPSGVAGEAMLRANTSQEQFGLIGAGRKNYIINGDFQVSQRGDFTSQTNISVSPTSTFYLDRWETYSIGSNSHVLIHKLDQLLPTNEYVNTVRITSTSSAGSTNNLAWWQWIEDYKAFRGQTATLSFWYKSNFDFVYNYYNHASQRHVNIPSSNGEWKYFTHTHTFESSGHNGLRLEFYPYGSVWENDQFFEFAQVQWELGSVATPFERRRYAEELRLCQRYYQRIQNGQLIGVRNTGTRLRLSAPLSPEMRAAPSVFRISGTTVSVQGDGLGFTSTQTAAAQGSPSGTTFMGFDLAGFTGVVDRTYPGSQSTVEVFECDAEL